MARGRSKDREEIMAAYYKTLITAAEQIVHKALALVDSAVPLMESLPSGERCSKQWPIFNDLVEKSPFSDEH